MNPRVLVIRTDFAHHGDRFGYKQLLAYIKPAFVFGVNERGPKPTTNILLRKYPWLYEFLAWPKRKQVDLVHIFYGEDYYRWSGFLFKGKPIVVTC